MHRISHGTSSRTNYISHRKALGGSRLFRTASGSISLFRAQREAIFLRRLRIKIIGVLLSRLVAARSRSSRPWQLPATAAKIARAIWEAAARARISCAQRGQHPFPFVFAKARIHSIDSERVPPRADAKKQSTRSCLSRRRRGQLPTPDSPMNEQAQQQHVEDEPLLRTSNSWPSDGMNRRCPVAAARAACLAGHAARAALAVARRRADARHRAQAQAQAHRLHQPGPRVSLD